MSLNTRLNYDFDIVFLFCVETLSLLLFGIVISVCVPVRSLSVSLSVCLYCDQLLDSLFAYMLTGLIACCLFAFLVLSICIFMRLLVVLSCDCACFCIFGMS